MADGRHLEKVISSYLSCESQDSEDIMCIAEESHDENRNFQYGGHFLAIGFCYISAPYVLSLHFNGHFSVEPGLAGVY